MSDHGGPAGPKQYPCLRCSKVCASVRGLTQHINGIPDCKLHYMTNNVNPPSVPVDEEDTDAPMDVYYSDTESTNRQRLMEQSDNEDWGGRMTSDEINLYSTPGLMETFGHLIHQACRKRLAKEKEAEEGEQGRAAAATRKAVEEGFEGLSVEAEEKEAEKGEQGKATAATKKTVEEGFEGLSGDEFENDPGDKAATEASKSRGKLLDYIQNSTSNVFQHATDQSLLTEKQRVDDSGYGQGEFEIDFTREERAQMQLLKLLKDANVPLYMYDSIIKWAQNVEKDGSVQFSSPSMSACRDTILKRLKGMCGLQPFNTTTIAMRLPGSGTKVSVVTVTFKKALFALLTCPMCMRDENLVFIQDTPGAFPGKEDDPQVLKEMIDGSVYLEAYRRLCTPPSQQAEGKRIEVLVTVPIFIDATHTDQNGNLCVEPVSISLSLFNKRWRMDPRAWRAIGYLINSSIILDSKKPSEKVKDYQAMLKEILSTLRQVMLTGGIDWDITYKGVVYHLTLKFAYQLLCADNEGADKAVCKFSVKTANVASICRNCNTPNAETGNPYYKFAYLQQEEMNEMIREKDVEGLRQLSFHCTPVALSDLVMCDEECGVYGSTPFDILHTVYLGTIMYILESLFGAKKLLKKQARNKKRKQTNQSGDKGKKKPKGSKSGQQQPLVDGIDLSERNGVFSDRVCKDVDKIAKIYGKSLSHQSDRNLPRTYFQQGITNNARKTGNENVGVLLVTLLCLLCSYDPGNDCKNEVQSTLGPTRFGAFIIVIESVLMMIAYLKSDEMIKTDLEQFQVFLPEFLRFLILTLDRQCGRGANILKWHLLLHLVRDILRHGPPDNYNTDHNEKGHKDSVKAPAQRTSRRIERFEYQIHQRYIENQTIDRCYFTCFGDTTASAPGVDEESSGVDDLNVVLSGKKYTFMRYVGFKVDKKEVNMEKNRIIWPLKEMHIQDMVQKCLQQICDQLRIGLMTDLQLYTQMKRDNVLFRADPNYKGVGWNDWAMIDWGPDYGWLPGHVMMFLEIPASDNFEPTTEVDAGDIDAPGTYALVLSVVRNPFILSEDIEIEEGLDEDEIKLRKWTGPVHDLSELCFQADRDEANLYLVPTDSFAAPCIGVPLDPYRVNYPDTFIFVKPREQWAKLFVERVIPTHIFQEKYNMIKDNIGDEDVDKDIPAEPTSPSKSPRRKSPKTKTTMTKADYERAMQEGDPATQSYLRRLAPYHHDVIDVQTDSQDEDKDGESDGKVQKEAATRLRMTQHLFPVEIDKEEDGMDDESDGKIHAEQKVGDESDQEDDNNENSVWKNTHCRPNMTCSEFIMASQKDEGREPYLPDPRPQGQKDYEDNEEAGEEESSDNESMEDEDCPVRRHLRSNTRTAAKRRSYYRDHPSI